MSDAEQKDTRDLETKLRQDIGLLEWQIRDLIPVIEDHYAQPTHQVEATDKNVGSPVDGELRGKILDNLALLLGGTKKDVHPDSLTAQVAEEIMQLLTAHLQTIEKTYGGCHNCYGKGYATRQAFGNGRVSIPQDPMVFCKCERGKQLEGLIDRRVQATQVKSYRAGLNDKHPDTYTKQELGKVVQTARHKDGEDYKKRLEMVVRDTQVKLAQEYVQAAVREAEVRGMQSAKSRVLRRTEIPTDAKNPIRDFVVILGEEIADIIQRDIDQLTQSTPKPTGEK